jgi:hypothetical protein
MVGKAQKSLGQDLDCMADVLMGVPPISMSVPIATFKSLNADAPQSLLRHSKKGLLELQ